MTSLRDGEACFAAPIEEDEETRCSGLFAPLLWTLPTIGYEVPTWFFLLALRSTYIGSFAVFATVNPVSICFLIGSGGRASICLFAPRLWRTILKKLSFPLSTWRGRKQGDFFVLSHPPSPSSVSTDRHLWPSGVMTHERPLCSPLLLLPTLSTQYMARCWSCCGGLDKVSVSLWSVSLRTKCENRVCGQVNEEKKNIWPHQV